ncbi:MAG TPA: tetratricopeptide repeat protein [Polyangia bacterium]|nr:tetratricopeptide repeat protein [Polyangia bacterium]
MRAALALLLLLSAGPAAAAEPQNPRALEEARTRFQAGVQLFHEGSFDAALAEFRKAYSLAPSYRVLFNIAQVQFELHDYVEALKTFRQYLQEGGADIPPDRRAQVDGEVQKLERRVSLVEIVVDVDGAEILLDDVPVGTSPMRLPLMVNAGNRRITATKPGRVTTARNLTVAGGDRVTIEMKLPEVAAVRLSDQPPVPASAAVPSAPSRTKMWVALATTAALGIGAGTFAILTQQAKHDFENQLAAFPTTKENIDQARHKMVVDAAITDGLAGAALLAGGITLYFALSHSGDEPEARQARIQVAPTLGGFSVSGSF